jgi:lysozyme
MQTSPQGRQLIEDFEGLYLSAYHDSVGVLTIGYGHTNIGNIPPFITPGMQISEVDADQALSDDLARFEDRVTKIIGDLSQCQFDALVSFDFNTGDLLSSSIPDKIKNGNIDAAMNTLLQYNHAGGKVLAGLTRRRQAEKLLFLGNVDEALALAKG